MISNRFFIFIVIFPFRKVFQLYRHPVRLPLALESLISFLINFIITRTSIQAHLNCAINNIAPS